MTHSTGVSGGGGGGLTEVMSDWSMQPTGVVVTWGTFSHVQEVAPMRKELDIVVDCSQ